MNAFRTPPKGQTSGKMTSPSGVKEKSIRSSVGEPEPAGASTMPTTTQAESIKRTTPQSQTQRTKNAVVNKTFVLEIPASQTQRPKGRVAEARACLEKGKNHLENSRNLKTEIKIGVNEVLSRLYLLVKEAEAELKQGKTIPETIGTKEIVPKAIEATATLPPNLDQERIVETLEEHTRLLLNNNKKLEEIQQRMESQKELLERASAETYASVAARQSPNRGTLHSVVVTSKDESETGEEVFDRVRQAVDAKDGWVKVERIRKARDRKIIMGFGTKEEREKVKERLGKDSVSLNVEDMKNKDPLLILRNVMSYNTDEDIAKALRNQNRGVFHALGEEDDRLEVRYRRKARNPHTGHVVISTSPVIWQRALRAGSLHIDLQRVKVEDQSPLVQCTKCLGYGHGRRLCREAVDLCSHCGGPHLRAECADFLADVPPKCRNCTKAGHERSEHNAFSLACPTRSRWDDLARASIAYC